MDHSSIERVLRVFSHQEPDRVPLDYSANFGIDAKLKGAFGLALDDREGLLEALGVDFVASGHRTDVPGFRASTVVVG